MRYFICIIIYGFFAVLYFCGCRTSPTSYFEYTEKNFFVFDTNDKAVFFEEYTPEQTKTENNIKRKMTDDGCTLIYEGERLLYKGNPGDAVFPVAEDDRFLYLLTEKDSEYQQAVKLCKKTGEISTLSKKNKECTGIIYHKKVHGIIYAEDEFSTDFSTPLFRTLHKKIIKDYQTENILWKNCTSDGKKWIVQLFFPDKPDIFLYCNMENCFYKQLSKVPEKNMFCRKKVYTYKSSDNKNISSILTFPPEKKYKKPYPLIVFPHGGPQVRSMLTFDARSDFLASKGFLVFQPNYRGSTGQGKTFRKQGWKAEGIRRGLDDIAEGSFSLIRDGYVQKENVFIFGGSWGGYCALSLAGLYPDLYKAAAAFFPPCDLPEMLRENLPDSGGEKGLDILQYGDINNAVEMNKLYKISPVFLAEKTTIPILLYHFENDTVTGFKQSENFVKKMKKLGKNIHFIRGKGSHGFSSPSEEEKAYIHLTSFFRKRITNEK